MPRSDTHTADHSARPTPSIDEVRRLLARYRPVRHQSRASPDTPPGSAPQYALAVAPPADVRGGWRGSRALVKLRLRAPLSDWIPGGTSGQNTP